MEKKWVITGLILIITAIILGAFGAHGLQTMLETASGFSPEEKSKTIESFETGTRYQFLIGLGFLLIPIWLKQYNLGGKMVFLLLLLGVLFFSGSIYGLTFSKIKGIDALNKVFGPITPIGGLLMIASWTILLVQIIRSK